MGALTFSKLTITNIIGKLIILIVQIIWLQWKESTFEILWPIKFLSMDTMVINKPKIVKVAQNNLDNVFLDAKYWV